jgi:hypothetical protein
MTDITASILLMKMELNNCLLLNDLVRMLLKQIEGIFFMVVGNRYYTSVSEGCLNGVMRENKF